MQLENNVKDIATKKRKDTAIKSVKKRMCLEKEQKDTVRRKNKCQLEKKKGCIKKKYKRM